MERDFAVRESFKILCCGNVEIEGAVNGEIDKGAALEARHNNADVGPEQAAKRLAPALGFAEKIAHLHLFLCRVAPTADFHLNLTSQSDGVNRLNRICIGDPEL